MLLSFCNLIIRYIIPQQPFRTTFPEEEEKYINLMLEGDTNARNILIEHNLRLVAHVAKKIH